MGIITAMKIGECVTEATIQNVETLIEMFYEWDNSGWPASRYLDAYCLAAITLEEINHEPEPIGGWYIDEEDRWAIFHAMEHIHERIIGIECTIHADSNKTCEELYKLYDHLVLKFR